MKTPFKLPIRLDNSALVAADQELIGEIFDATDDELKYILRAVNNYQKMLDCIKQLREYAINATLEGDPLPRCVGDAGEIVARDVAYEITR